MIKSIMSDKEEEEDIKLYENHSCNPNVGLREEITFAAIRDINKDEELTTDYAFIDNEDYKFECTCDSKNCRKIVTDFLSYRGWEIMLEFLKEYDVLIWGRKTWDNIMYLGEEYLNDLKDINIIILSETSKKQDEFSNVAYCNSIDDCLKVCERMKYGKLFISGGATINILWKKE